jgi:hypothetical protein
MLTSSNVASAEGVDSEVERPVGDDSVGVRVAEGVGLPDPCRRFEQPARGTSAQDVRNARRRISGGTVPTAKERVVLDTETTARLADGVATDVER